VQFKDGVDLSRIEGFTIVYKRLGRQIQQLYFYNAISFDNNSGIETDGRTYVQNIPTRNVSDSVKVSILITTNGNLHHRSTPVTLETCIDQEITTTEGT